MHSPAGGAGARLWFAAVRALIAMILPLLLARSRNATSPAA
jgi:hypothetical protein